MLLRFATLLLAAFHISQIPICKQSLLTLALRWAGSHIKGVDDKVEHTIVHDGVMQGL